MLLNFSASCIENTSPCFPHSRFSLDEDLTVQGINPCSPCGKLTAQGKFPAETTGTKSRWEAAPALSCSRVEMRAWVWHPGGPTRGIPSGTSSHLVGRSPSPAAHLGLERQMLDLNDYTVGSQCRKSIKIPSSLETGALITHRQVFKGKRNHQARVRPPVPLGSLFQSSQDVSMECFLSIQRRWLGLCCLLGGVWALSPQDTGVWCWWPGVGSEG